MRMRFLLLAAAGLGLIAVAGMALERGPAQLGQPPGQPSLACPALGRQIGAADRLELTHGGQVVWLERRGSVWGLARQGGYPAQPTRADALIAALTGLTLIEPNPAPPATLGLADPTQPVATTGTLIRVLGISGATLCALIAGPNAAVRRPGEPQAWTVAAPLPVDPAQASWSQHALPPLEAAVGMVTDDGGLDPEAVLPLLRDIAFIDVRPRPQAHLAPLRTLRLALADGTVTLSVGMEGGKPWLLVSGTSPWARPLAPYAFALPPDSGLAAP